MVGKVFHEFIVSGVVRPKMFAQRFDVNATEHLDQPRGSSEAIVVTNAVIRELELLLGMRKGSSELPILRLQGAKVSGCFGWYYRCSLIPMRGFRRRLGAHFVEAML